MWYIFAAAPARPLDPPSRPLAQSAATACRHPQERPMEIDHTSTKFASMVRAQRTVHPSLVLVRGSQATHG
jgi:hypothetical protein